MARVKSDFNIVAYQDSGQVVTLHKNVKSGKLIPLLDADKKFIDNNFARLSVERIADGLKIVVNVVRQIRKFHNRLGHIKAE